MGLGSCFVSERLAGKIPEVRALHKGTIHASEHILPVASVKDESPEEPVTEIDYMLLPGHGLFSNPRTD
jgi:hypothetical protein